MQMKATKTVERMHRIRTALMRRAKTAPMHRARIVLMHETRMHSMRQIITKVAAEDHP